MPDGRHAYLYSRQICSVYYIDLETGAPIANVTVVPGCVGAIGLNPGGSRLFLPGGSGTGSPFSVSVIDTSTNTLIQTTTLTGTDNPVFDNYQFGFSADGSLAYFPSPSFASTTSSLPMYMLDGKTGLLVGSKNLPMAANAFAVAASANEFAISGLAGTAQTPAVMILDSNLHVVKQFALASDTWNYGQIAIGSARFTFPDCGSI
jgi:hypothetical protein